MTIACIIDGHGCTNTENSLIIIPPNINIFFRSKDGQCPSWYSPYYNYRFLDIMGKSETPYFRKQLRRLQYQHYDISLEKIRAIPEDEFIAEKISGSNDDKKQVLIFNMEFEINRGGISDWKNVTPEGFNNSILTIYSDNTMTDNSIKDGIRLSDIIDTLISSRSDPDTTINIYINACRSPCSIEVSDETEWDEFEKELLEQMDTIDNTLEKKSNMSMQVIEKGEHGDIVTDGDIVCKTESYDKRYIDNMVDIQYKLLTVLHDMDICPAPISVEINKPEATICMTHGGNDFDYKLPISEAPELSKALDYLASILSSTKLIFVDLCLLFNPGNIVYREGKVLLIDIDPKFILLSTNIPEGYWNEIFGVYRDYVLSAEDVEYEEGDADDHFSSQLYNINNKYINNMVFSQSFASDNIDVNDITPELLKTDSNKLFTGKLITRPFMGKFNTKAHYMTVTPIMAKMGI